MIEAQSDESYVTALRQLLVEQVATTPRRRLGPMTVRRWVGAAGAALLLGAAGSGIAYAAGAFSTLAGATVTTALSAPVVVSGTGTQRVDLGRRPARADAVTVTLICLSRGSVEFPGGGSIDCANGRGSVNSRTGFESVSVPPGVHTLTITATPGMRWRFTGTWATLTATPWGVNAHGQTYGVIDARGTPDLVAVQATNHRQGYAYASQLQGPTPTSPEQAAAESRHPHARTITVYESDGVTPIGVFRTDP